VASTPEAADSSLRVLVRPLVLLQVSLAASKGGCPKLFYWPSASDYDGGRTAARCRAVGPIVELVVVRDKLTQAHKVRRTVDTLFSHCISSKAENG